jgi:hypothetical protein
MGSDTIIFRHFAMKAGRYGSNTHAGVDQMDTFGSFSTAC